MSAVVTWPNRPLKAFLVFLAVVLTKRAFKASLYVKSAQVRLQTSTGRSAVSIISMIYAKSCAQPRSLIAFSRRVYILPKSASERLPCLLDSPTRSNISKNFFHGICCAPRDAKKHEMWLTTHWTVALTGFLSSIHFCKALNTSLSSLGR